jgi:hypothetical protein
MKANVQIDLLLPNHYYWAFLEAKNVGIQEEELQTESRDIRRRHGFARKHVQELLHWTCLQADQHSKLSLQSQRPGWPRHNDEYSSYF